MAYGDHLRVKTKYHVIMHHGIECGEENGIVQVIHFSRQDGSLSIKKTSLQEFANGNVVEIINYYDAVKCNNRQDTVDNAKYLYDNQKKHNLSYKWASFNCEHLSTICKVFPSNELKNILTASESKKFKELFHNSKSYQVRTFFALPVRAVLFLLGSLNLFAGNPLVIFPLLYLILKTIIEITDGSQINAYFPSSLSLYSSFTIRNLENHKPVGNRPPTIYIL